MAYNISNAKRRSNIRSFKDHFSNQHKTVHDINASKSLAAWDRYFPGYLIK